jgi:hypothetical protein
MAEHPHKSIANTWDETYTLSENFFLAYQRLGEERYRELGKRFIYHEYFDALAEEHNVLPGKHAYSHVNALSSAMQAYFVLGDEKHLRAARNGLRMVHEQSYATGGWGPREAFVEPRKGLLGKSLNRASATRGPVFNSLRSNSKGRHGPWRVVSRALVASPWQTICPVGEKSDRGRTHSNSLKHY